MELLGQMGSVVWEDNVEVSEVELSCAMSKYYDTRVLGPLTTLQAPELGQSEMVDKILHWYSMERQPHRIPDYKSFQ